jgi:hypothetical protein
MSFTLRNSNLSLDSSARRRAAYTLAAGAAACTAANTAEAVVNYSGLQNISIGSGFSQQLDINLDSFNDLKLTNYVFGSGPYQGATVNFAPGKLVGFTSGTLAYVSALTVYDSIGSANAGPSFYGSLAYGAANPNAEFNNVSDAFIGLSFPAGPNLYYGWVRVAIDNANKSFVIKDWAYEDNSVAALAGSPMTDGILAGDTGDGFVPEPGTLGLLAAGAAGVVGMRRRRRASGN